ncbi:hypothetical protein [Streptomyces xinghaiensis]|uniref:hypothetical protein n=1 Tax=Streptomyces xinghaiensis TaxID=1038928 RepID=UPI0002F51423|nr:hypothetical protein [Streptomyces xinghaiensis]MZE81709.1 hypothetical protein [Streptomyces sp. SID5475]
MFTTTKPTVAKTLLAASVLLTGALLSGCSDDSSAASAGDTDSEASASPGSPFEQALAFSQCMRDNGVAGFPDPQQQEGGGIALSPGDGNVDPNSESFKSAQEACRDKMPQGQLGGGGGNGEPLDSAKVAAWAKCMRENGLPKFPDPEINGNNLGIDFAGSGINPADDEFQQARAACQDKWPGGGVTISGGGAQ